MPEILPIFAAADAFAPEAIAATSIDAFLPGISAAEFAPAAAAGAAAAPEFASAAFAADPLSALSSLPEGVFAGPAEGVTGITSIPGDVTAGAFGGGAADFGAVPLDASAATGFGGPAISTADFAAGLPSTAALPSTVAPDVTAGAFGGAAAAPNISSFATSALDPFSGGLPAATDAFNQLDPFTQAALQGQTTPTALQTTDIATSASAQGGGGAFGTSNLPSEFFTQPGTSVNDILFQPGTTTGLPEGVQPVNFTNPNLTGDFNPNFFDQTGEFRPSPMTPVSQGTFADVTPAQTALNLPNTTTISETFPNQTVAQESFPDQGALNTTTTGTPTPIPRNVAIPDEFGGFGGTQDIAANLPTASETPVAGGPSDVTTPGGLPFNNPPLNITPTTPATPAGAGGVTGAFGNLLASNPLMAASLGLGALGLGFSVFRNLQQLPEQKQLEALAAQLASNSAQQQAQASALINPLITGQLPPNLAQQVVQAQQDAITQIKARYASSGQAGSSAEISDIAASIQHSAVVAGQLEQQLATAGVQLTSAATQGLNVESTIFQALLNAQVNANDAFAAAIANFAGQSAIASAVAGRPAGR